MNPEQAIDITGSPTRSSESSVLGGFERKKMLDKGGDIDMTAEMDDPTTSTLLGGSTTQAVYRSSWHMNLFKSIKSYSYRQVTAQVKYAAL